MRLTTITLANAYMAIFIIFILELRNAKIYGLFEQKHLENKKVLRPEDLNFCIS